MCKALCNCKISIKSVVDFEYFESRKKCNATALGKVFRPNVYSIFLVFFLLLIQQFIKLEANATVLIKYLKSI